MIRYIKLSNDKKRDAEVTFKSLNPKPKIKMVMESGEEVINKRVVKGTSIQTVESLFAKYDEKPKEGVDFEMQLAARLSEDLVSSDPELDLELSGKFIEDVSRVYINEDQKPVFRVKKVEKIFSPKAELKEEREPKYNDSNISGENPVNWTGKMMPKLKVYNKLVFDKKYQLRHVNGLTYDFLYEIAKELSDKNSLMMLAGGSSGKEPLVMNDGGKPYRAFLEGRIQGEKYCLILHLTDQELKPLPTE
jgi:hypothetical protein|tara:strand:+ start:5680 stop:6423 length:744 start_codon:yes stop_codon:yes gene_type:complete